MSCETIHIQSTCEDEIIVVGISGPQGSSGSSDWNDITNKPTAFPPETHAATHLPEGSDELYDQSLNTTDEATFVSAAVEKVIFNQAAAVEVVEGELAWNNDEKTLDLGLAHDSVLQVGQETVYHVENGTSSPLAQGTLVIFAGTVGNSGKLRVAPHVNNDAPVRIMGIVTSTIAGEIGATGYVTHFGKVRGLNASGSTVGETWLNGDVLYAKPTGGLTKVAPAAPIITVAAVVSNNASNGTLFVRPSFGQTASDIGAATESDLLGHTGRTDNPHSVTKDQVGLGNVDNTSDLNKPISSATQSALDGKQPSGDYVLTTDARLSDARTPTAHKSTHATGGSDALSPADIGAITDAPTNGDLYARKDGAWELAASPDDIPLVPSLFYYGTTNSTSFLLGDIPDHYADSDTDLTRLFLGNSVSSIGDYAFQYNHSLTGGITIPNSVTEIGHGAFQGLYGLTGTLTLGNSLTSIGNYAFLACSFTGDVIIPDSVLTIGSSAFNGVSNATGLTIGNSVTSIGSAAFFFSSFTGDLIIPDSVNTIGDTAFTLCSGFTSLIIGNSVTTIGSSAFYFCSGLTGNLVIPDSVTSIGDGAFNSCSGLTAVYLNLPIGSIGAGVFSNSGITDIYIGPDATGYTLGSGQDISGATVTVSEWTNYPNVP